MAKKVNSYNYNSGRKKTVCRELLKRKPSNNLLSISIIDVTKLKVDLRNKAYNDIYCCININ